MTPGLRELCLTAVPMSFSLYEFSPCIWVLWESMGLGSRRRRQRTEPKAQADYLLSTTYSNAVKCFVNCKARGGVIFSASWLLEANSLSRKHTLPLRMLFFPMQSMLLQHPSGAVSKHFLYSSCKTLTLPWCHHWSKSLNINFLNSF